MTPSSLSMKPSPPKWVGWPLIICLMFCILATLIAEPGMGEQSPTTGTAAVAVVETAQPPVTVVTPAGSEDIRNRPVTPLMALRAALILVLFVILAASIATRRMPAMVAMPLMALGVALLAGIPLYGANGDNIIQGLLEGRTDGPITGSFRNYQPIIYVLFGGMFARFIGDSGIAERIVKFAAEFGGENPYRIALLMSGITVVIFASGLGGLPAIIMLGTVMFPVLMSLGVPPVICGSLLLMAFPIGTFLSPATWPQLAKLYDVPLEEVRRFSLLWAGLQTAVLVTFLSIEFLRMKRTTVTPANVLVSVAMLAGVAVAFFLLSNWKTLLPAGDYEVQVDAALGMTGTGLQVLVVLILLGAVATAQIGYWIYGRTAPGWNLITPILPLVFVLGLGFDKAIIPAFLASLTYGFLTTPRERGMQRLGRSIMDGVADVAAPVVLLLGLGILITAANHENVKYLLVPILAGVVPVTIVGYIIFFFILSPLSLYRGPLNNFGLGVGFANVLKDLIPSGGAMGAIQSVSMLQDPTTTQNIWVCGYLKLDINAILFKLFFYSLTLVLAGLLLSATLFLVPASG